jgi:hypothetical protein
MWRHGKRQCRLGLGRDFKPVVNPVAYYPGNCPPDSSTVTTFFSASDTFLSIKKVTQFTFMIHAQRVKEITRFPLTPAYSGKVS